MACNETNFFLGAYFLFPSLLFDREDKGGWLNFGLFFTNEDNEQIKTKIRVFRRDDGSLMFRADDKRIVGLKQSGLLLRPRLENFGIGKPYNLEARYGANCGVKCQFLLESQGVLSPGDLWPFQKAFLT